MTTAFALIIELELRFRILIPHYLREHQVFYELTHWHEDISLSFSGEKSLLRARMKLKRNEHNFVEDFLPFGFWQNTVHEKNFTKLWVPFLHKAFPGIVDAASMPKMKEVEQRMITASEFRNLVSHHNRKVLIDYEANIENLLWLIDAMR